jgi:methylmalonyl-CoA mutase cobalamin-binding subunit
VRAGISVQGREAQVLAMIATAVLSPDRTEGERQLRSLLADGLDRQRLVDEWIPAVARRFGDAWAQSGHSFVEVSIAVARLQGWLREIEAPRPDAPFRLDAPEVLLVVAEGAHHTLGAMVAMSRFRRLGALVRLSLGQDARSVGQIVRAQHVDMVALSAAGNEDLEFLTTLIHSIRSGVGPAPHVVVGGEILNQHPDAPALIGADFATSDPEEALELCGLTTSASAGPSPKAGRAAARGQPERVPTGA